MTLPTAVPAEIRLALLCARTELSVADGEAIDALLGGEIDWEAFSVFVDRHYLAALVNVHFRSRAAHVPAEYVEGLRSYGRRLALVNLGQVNELLRIVRLLEGQNVPVVPFKGPMLGATVYGNPALRRFGDLDVLVHRADLERARDAVAEAGYAPYRQMTPENEQAFFRTGMGFEMVRHDQRAIVELHWTFLNRAHSFRLDPEAVWARTRFIEVGGERVRSFAPEDLLIYLCAHGSKSLWERLIWACDVAELLRRTPALRWDDVLGTARTIHAERMLFTGLALANQWLGAPLPPDLEARLRADGAVRALVAQVARHTLVLDGHPLSEDEKIGFHLHMRDRLFDRLPYYGHLIRIKGQPNAKDRAFVRLPKPLAFLYPIIKPIRLLRTLLDRRAALRQAMEKRR